VARWGGHGSGCGRGRPGRRSRPGVSSWAAITGGAMVVALACAGLSGAVRVPNASKRGHRHPRGRGVSCRHPAARGRVARAPLAPVPPAPAARAASSTGGSAAGGSGSGGPRRGGFSPGGGPAGSASVPAASLRTSCHAVTHIGDSTSEGLVSRAYLPKPGERLAAQYRDVGAGSVRWDHLRRPLRGGGSAGPGQRLRRGGVDLPGRIPWLLGDGARHE